jgi:antitoxin HicB
VISFDGWSGKDLNEFLWPDRTISIFIVSCGGASSFHIRSGIWQSERYGPFIATRLDKGLKEMPHYIALVHKDADSCYGVSFPDLPGVFTAGDTIDEAIRNAAEVVEFAAEDWSDLSGEDFPAPRTIDQLRADPAFQESAADAVVAAVPFRAKAEATA